MPDAMPEFLSLQDRQLQSGSILLFPLKWQHETLTEKIVYTSAFQPWINTASISVVKHPAISCHIDFTPC